MIHNKWIHDRMSAAAEIARRLTQKHIADHTPYGLTAVNNHVRRGKFPAEWYLVIKRLCREAGIDCPKSAFKFLEPMHSGSAILAANGTGPDTGAADPDAGPEYMGAAGARSESGIPESGCVDG